jgi:hypothetical protein
MSNLTKEILQGKFEKTEKDGEIYLPQAKVFIGGAFEYWLNDEEHYADGNIVVNEGLDHLLDVTLSNGTQKANWFVSIFKANYTPVSTDTAQNISTNSTEVVGSGDVAETARQAWVEPATGTLTAYGAFLISTSAYGNGISSDKLLAASAFSAPRSMIATDILNVTYTLNVADA